MPLFTNVSLGVEKQLDAREYKSSFRDRVAASFEMAFESNPMQVLERRRKMGGLDDIAWEDSQLPLDAREVIDIEDFATEQKQKALPLEDQARQIREAGLEGQVKPVEGYRQEALNIVMENKRMENEISVLDPGLGSGLIGGLAAGFLDPVNLASAFVPVIGEQRLMSLMQAARGIGHRAAIRAEIGAASGAAGAAMLEPMIYLGQQEIQADYSLANSLQNLALGAIMGSGMHAAGGTFTEWRRARSGKPQSWDYVPEDYYSEELKQAHAEDLYRYQMEATPEEDPEIVRQQMDAVAADFDARAKNWAVREKKTVKEFYDQWRPEYRSWQDDFVWREALPEEYRGNADGDGDLGWIGRQYEGLRTLNSDAMSYSEFLDNLALWEERFPDLHDYAGIRQAMEDARAGKINANDVRLHARYLARDANTNDFAARVLSEGKDGKASVRVFGNIKRQELNIADAAIELGSDRVEHIHNRHPDFESWDQIENIIQNGKSFRIRPDRQAKTPSFAFAAKIDDKLLAVLGHAQETRRGHRFVVETAFESNERNFLNWLKQIKAIEPYQSAGGKIPALPKSVETERLSDLRPNGFGIQILNQSEDVNPVIDKKTRVLGPNFKEIARYELRESDGLISSHDIEKTDTLYQLEDEPAKASSSTGRLNVLGSIGEEAAAEMNLPGAGEFVFDAEKFAHIDPKHGEQFKKLGFENAEGMARYVLENVEAIYDAGNGAFRLTRQIVNRENRYANMVAEFVARKEGNNFRITTVFPVRKKFLKNKKLLWECAPNIHSENPQAPVSGMIRGQSNNKNNLYTNDLVVNQGDTYTQG